MSSVQTENFSKIDEPIQVHREPVRSSLRLRSDTSGLVYQLHFLLCFCWS